MRFITYFYQRRDKILKSKYYTVLFIKISIITIYQPSYKHKMIQIYDFPKHLLICRSDFRFPNAYHVSSKSWRLHSIQWMPSVELFLICIRLHKVYFMNNIYAFRFEFRNTFLKTRCHQYHLCYTTNAILVLFNVRLRSGGFICIIKGSKCLNFEFQSPMWFLIMHSHFRSYELCIWVGDIEICCSKMFLILNLPDIPIFITLFVLLVLKA